MQAAARFRSLTILFLLLVLAGCGQTPDRAEQRPGDRADVRRAEALLAAEHYTAAADIYRQLAARTPPDQRRAAYLLMAAEASRSGTDWDGIRIALAELDALQLAGEQALHRRLLRAEVLLREMRPVDALETLGAAPTDDTPLRSRFYRTQADAYRLMGNLLETAHALQALDALEDDPQQRLQIQTEILRTLALLNERALERLQPSPPGISGGWMQLALLVKAQEVGTADIEPEFADWRRRFPQHPALPELLANYRLQLQQQLQPVSRIAVLLPQSGVYANVAAAIRDGIIISRFEQAPGQRTELRFYDSTDPTGIWPLYSRAVADGAELVIGPLQKEAVVQLTRAGELPVPVLALNQVTLENAPPLNLFMYSLSPEDEARQAAERAWLDGHRRPAVLAPQGTWGDRLAEAFEARWETLGGSVAGTARYDATSHDYSEAITSLLHLDQSEARHQEVQKWLGKRLEFEPRRRDDVDAVFMAARPVQAQGIRPQLQFHHAADLPLFATSHAWFGRLTPGQVEDLRGVMLADIPWMVADDAGDPDSRSAIAHYLPKSGSGYARLYAMGMDALSLVPHLGRLQSSRYESLDGRTGNLYMDETNQIHRQLVWVRLDAEPEILGFAPRLDLQGGAASAPVTSGESSTTDTPPPS